MLFMAPTDYSQPLLGNQLNTQVLKDDTQVKMYLQNIVYNQNAHEEHSIRSFLEQIEKSLRSLQIRNI